MLSSKEIKRIKVMELLCKGSIDNQQAAEILGICERQIIRLKNKYSVQGYKGLIHGNRRRISCKKTRDETVVTLFKEKYFDFNFPHFTEKLNDVEGIRISRSGELPTGLKLTYSGTKAKISGTPTSSGTFTFTLKVTDANKATAT